MKSLLIVLFAATVSAGSFKVGNIKCTYGPSYWCKNYKQAKECDAIQHCQETVWKQKVSSNDLKCIGCHIAVTYLTTQLQNSTFQKQIVNSLEGVCVRFSALAPECKALIEKYASLVFSELLKIMKDPKAFCTKLGLCSASKEKIMAVLLHKAISMKQKTFAEIVMKKHARNTLKSVSIQASAKCILCEFVADKLDQTLSKKATQQEIKNAVGKVCSKIPSNIGTECKDFVEEYSVEIIQLLSQEFKPKILCSALRLCTSKDKTKKMQSNGEICDICTTTLTFVKNFLQDNTTEKEIVDELKQLCNDLPEQLQSQCTALVSQYGMMILKLIASSDAKTLCTDIGLCTSKLHSVIALKDKCYLGASYWCSSHANAIMCTKTAFCLKNGWLSQ